MRLRPGWLLLLLLAFVPAARAHVGSKDVFETIDAGPYRLFVTIRPPNVIPGIATVEVRVSGPAVTAINITPIPLTGEASKHPPSSDKMTASKVDAAFYTGQVWMMARGSWRVRFNVEGAGGEQTASVPVVAAPLATLQLPFGIGLLLGFLGAFLMVSMAALVGAAVREARLAPGAEPSPSWRRRAALATAGAGIAMGFLGLVGVKWSSVKAANYQKTIYQPMPSSARLSGDVLDLKVGEAVTGAKDGPPVGPVSSDLLPDHGHLMHLYAIRQPAMDAVFHLHPELVAAGDFRLKLPAMPAGIYTLYGDIVHTSGFPETLVAKLVVPPGLPDNRLASDDAEALPPPLSAGMLGLRYALPDGYTMVWDRPATLTATTPYSFHFRLLGPDGKPATNMQPYMGMAGHAAFVKTDGTVFAHTHPEGSAAMAALDLANGPMQSMSAMHGASQPTAPEVDFPYGFPTPGAYRIFIQMKHGDTIETGAFDASVQ